jgi:Mn2+/Fe2+ NRAMP family transporter
MARRSTHRIHHPHRRHLRGSGYFKRLGPGLVTGAADDDPSGIGTYSQVGARFGLTYTWSALYVLPMAVAVQETAARLGLVTGRGLAALIRSRFSRPVLVIAVVLVAAANTFNIAADLASMGAAAHLLIPVPQTLLVVAMTAAMLALEIFVPYHSYARVLRWFALSLGAYVLVLFSVDVDWVDVAHHTVVPHITFGRADLAALIAIFGTTVSPYLFFWQASEEVEEEAGTLDLTPDHITAMRVDVASGMGSGVFVMFAIITAAAVTLNRHGLTDIGTAEQAARALRPIAGRFAGLLFATGIVGLGLLAVPVLAGSTAYALSEAFGWHEGLSQTFRQARGFYLVIAASMVGGLVIDAVGIDPIRGLFLAAILNGLAAPPLILLMVVLARDRAVMGQHRSGRLSSTFMVLTLLASTALPALWLIAS